MNWAHAHLILNHIPILGIIFGLALILVAVFKKSDELLRASLGTFVVVGVMSIATYLTGEPAEEVVEHLAGISEANIERHEESALWALVATQALGIYSLIGLFVLRKSRDVSRQVATVCIGIALLAVGAVGWTAHLGRQIHHAEIGSAGPADAHEHD
ncbi:MAG: hypothetical protein HYX72_15300 [Acidobacteria bacterium]|nr:hypothetical protein [Acidobacteriota bacterium]